MIRKLAATLALASLAACGGSQDKAAQDGQATPTPTPTPTETATAEASPTPTPDPSETPVEVTIPKSIQGRWGLVPADCTSTKGDAKGLLTITPTRLEFYESLGKMTDIEELAANHLEASFDFTGEGLEWQRIQQLDVSDDGKTLVRRELGDDAAPGPYKYLRCSKVDPKQ